MDDRRPSPPRAARAGAGPRQQGRRSDHRVPDAPRDGTRGGGHRGDDLDGGPDGHLGRDRPAARRHRRGVGVSSIGKAVGLGHGNSCAELREHGTLAQLVASTEPLGDLWAEPDTVTGPDIQTVAYVYADDGTYRYTATNSPADPVAHTVPQPRRDTLAHARAHADTATHADTDSNSCADSDTATARLSPPAALPQAEDDQ